MATPVLFLQSKSLSPQRFQRLIDLGGINMIIISQQRPRLLGRGLERVMEFKSEYYWSLKVTGRV